MSSASSSAGGTWNPLYLMISLSLSTMKISSSSSTKPMSPVCSHPSMEGLAWVGVGDVCTFHDLFSADADLAGLVPAEGGAGVGVDDLQLRVAHHCTARPG
ncbi:Os02g0177666, partial [Oryza sativa Japonica Group]